MLLESLLEELGKESVVSLIVGTIQINSEANSRLQLVEQGLVDLLGEVDNLESFLENDD